MLAWLFQETGCELVEKALPGIISAVNLTEVVYVGIRRGLDPHEIHDTLVDLPLTVVPYQFEDVLPAATLHGRTRGAGLSLADCICITVAAKHGLPVLTADSGWAKLKLPTKVKVIR